jgi:hypothetical protein
MTARKLYHIVETNTNTALGAMSVVDVVADKLTSRKDAEIVLASLNAYPEHGIYYHIDWDWK